MRPSKLTMKAFGAYADETTVDFDAFGDGLYLIAGPTGAGKTTVFDAIAFALFGVPSGSERTTDMLHSDFAPLSTDTIVILEFTHQGRHYKVERKLHYVHKKDTGEYSLASPQATFHDNAETITGAKRVTQRIEELLGLDAGQFRRIVMLAQGEFREFLKANSERKNAILGKLFGNAEYEGLQNLLGETRRRLERRRQDRYEEIVVAMETMFVLPEELGGTDEEGRFLPGNPHLEESLSTLVDDDEAQLAALHSDGLAKAEIVEGLARRLGAAEADNSLLDELARMREELESLESEADAVAAKETEYAAAEKALHKVMPRVNEVTRTEGELDRTRWDVDQQAKEMEARQASLSEVQAAADGDGEAQERISAIVAEVAALEATREGYERLYAEIVAIDEEREEHQGASARLEELDARRTDAAERLDAMRGELAELEGCGEEAERLRTRLAVAKERCVAVSGIAAEVSDISEEDARLSADAERLVRLTKVATEASERRADLYRRFVAAQASLIAAGLETELAEVGHAMCPVCHSEFHAGDAHDFAVPVDDEPTQDDVDAAERAAAEAEAERQALHGDIKVKKATVAQRRQAAVERVRTIDSECDGWDAMTASGHLDALAGRLRDELDGAEAAHAEASAKVGRRSELLGQEPEAAAELASLDEESKSVRERVDRLALSVSSREAEVERLRGSLAFRSWDEAEGRIRELQDEQQSLREQIRMHAEALSEAKAACDETAGRLSTLRDSLPRLEEAASAAASGFATALRENGFADVSAVEDALAPAGDEDGEAWLTSRRAELDDYARSLEATRSRIAELEAQTEGKERIDLTSLQSELDVARQEREGLAEEETARQSLLDNHRSVLDRVRAARRELDSTEGAWQRIDRLASLATGANSDMGRLSFERYVMGTIFKEVLEMANRRLDIMTGGRFELVHVMGGKRKNSLAGLDIEVLDRETGRQRASGSISGGEGFLVSLALALGLSDVVQSHAGGQRLDTLFIDEGFGTLDDGKLDSVIAVLQQLADGNRLVGVISHVDKLEESIPHKLRVTSGGRGRGSSIEMELS